MKFDLSKINKSYLIAGIIFVLVIGIVAIVIFSSGAEEEVSAEEEKTAEKPEVMDVIPTVDSSVKVDLEGIANNTKVVVTVENAPEGTEDVEMDMSYERTEKGMEQPVQDGSFHTIDIIKGKGEVEVDLGTCSSGVCRYHNLTDGEIRVQMKFIGSYGEKIYENVFQLDV